MKRFTIKEPTEKEFKAFKRAFLQKKAEDYYATDVKREIADLMRIIGGYQAEISRLEDIIATIKQQKATYTVVEKINKTKNRNVLKQYMMALLNESLFLELKNGTLYV